LVPENHYSLAELVNDGESASQIDDGDQGAGQHPVGLKSVNNGDHAGCYESDDEHVKPLHPWISRQSWP
jgi:hypothetical protein